MKKIQLLASLILICCMVQAQYYMTGTYAGTGLTTYNSDNIQATAANLNYPMHMDFDATGNLYFADFNHARIRKINTTTGVITTAAGSGVVSYSGDGGQATAAGMNQPRAVAFDSAGNMFIAEYNSSRIRRVDAVTGIITTLAGTATPGYSGDGGPSTAAQIHFPLSIRVDRRGNVYFIDNFSHYLRKISAQTGIITTICGSSVTTFNGDNIQAINANLTGAEGLALDVAGNIYIADAGSNRIRKITVSTGVITTVAGSGTSGFSGDGGLATAAGLQTPYAVAVDDSNNIYTADNGNRIRKVDAGTGIITTIAGNGSTGSGGDGGLSIAATFNQCRSISIAHDGRIYVGENAGLRIRVLTPTILYPPTISSFSAASGPIGTLVTISGTYLYSGSTAVSIGGVPSIVISNTSSTIVAMVMPGATTGAVSVTTPAGSVTAAGSFTITSTPYPAVQQGSKFVGTGAVGVNPDGPEQGISVAVSADGNTAMVGGYHDNNGVGAVWVYTRSGGIWTQQGGKLAGTGAVGTGSAQQGCSVALSADGNTAIVGGANDNSGIGAAWIFTRSGGIWSQQGAKLVGTSPISTPHQGQTVALSADGNTAIVGGPDDNSIIGAAWIYRRLGTTWYQQGKFIGSGITNFTANQGSSVALSADGNTAIVGGPLDNNGAGAVWIFAYSGGSWSQQGQKLVGTGAVVVQGGNGPYLGASVALSADGNTAIVGGSVDNGYIGAAWVFIRSGSTWRQQGSKLVGTGTVTYSNLGSAISLSADGNTAIVGAYGSEGTWVFTRTDTTWTQRGQKLSGTGVVGTSGSRQGSAIALSADGTTAFVGGYYDNSQAGAAWAFIAALPPTVSSFSPASGPVGTLVTITGTNLYQDAATVVSIGGVSAIVVSTTGSSLIAMVMPGAASGGVSVSTAGGLATASGSFSVTATPYPALQQGAKLVGTGATGLAQQGYSTAVSADGNTAIVGGYRDNSGRGAVWIYVRSGNIWSQQGSKLVGTGAVGLAHQGYSVALSADGNTAIVGGNNDNSTAGAVWIFTRSGSSWSQQGAKLVGTGTAPGGSSQGSSVALSADGNTAIVGGSTDSSYYGAVWIYTRNGGIWTQQGGKLVGTGALGGPVYSTVYQGYSVSLSADGNTAMVGGYFDNNEKGAAWVYVQGNRV